MCFRRFLFVLEKAMKIKYTIISCIILSIPAIAQTPPPTPTVFFENSPQINPDLLLDQRSIDPLISVPIEDGNRLEDSINFALTTKDWDRLTTLLEEYRTTDNFDITLYDYALGALYRKQGRQKEAITLYRKILSRLPGLHYVRFDLAMMLHEDKQYAEAKKQFEQVKPNLTPNLQALIKRILTAMQENQSWQPILNLSYEATDNVNQASDIKKLVTNNATFIRSEDSLPQDAHGIRYGISGVKEKNIIGNHYLYTEADLRGVSYWDNSDYSETTFQAGLGYQNKNIKQSWGLTTTFEQNLLGGSQYNRNYIASLNYNRQLTDKLQISSNFTHLQKRYDDNVLAAYYDGHANSTVWTTIYKPKPRFLVYSGIDFKRDSLNDDAESSNQYGIRTGMVFNGDTIISKGSLRYSKRNFWEDNFWYGESRKDNEYQFKTAIGHKDLQFFGFTPELNYMYRKIDSNLPLYERSNSTFFLEMKKLF